MALIYVQMLGNEGLSFQLSLSKNLEKGEPCLTSDCILVIK